MSWETRNGKGRYYTRSVRIGGRIVREYIGAGVYGECIAADDARARAERADQAAAARAEIEHLADLDELVAASARSAQVVASEALIAAGYRRHQRGEWRKTRGQA
jgi:hypothetical protein